jgi:hypothetical protein
MRGKSNPPKRLLDAVAMESANRAITQQTLTRLKEIATGQAGAAAAEEKPKKAPAGKKVAGAKTGGRTRKSTPKKATPGKPAASPKRKKAPAK